MLTYLSSSIWASSAWALVKTVNMDISLWYSLEYLQIGIRTPRNYAFQLSIKFKRSITTY